MLPESVTSLLGGGKPDIVLECRRCGTTVDGDDVCPHCGPDAEVVKYVID